MDVCKSDHPFPYRNSEHTCAYSYLAPILVKILGEGKTLNILELGCGNGYFCDVLSKMGHKVVGVDISEIGISIAKKSFPHIQFMKCDIYNIEADPMFSGKYFDVIVAIEVIEHLQYPKEFIKIAKKYLKQQGQLIVTTPYHGYLKNLMLY